MKEVKSPNNFFFLTPIRTFHQRCEDDEETVTDVAITPCPETKPYINNPIDGFSVGLGSAVLSKEW